MNKITFNCVYCGHISDKDQVVCGIVAGRFMFGCCIMWNITGFVSFYVKNTMFWLYFIDNTPKQDANVRIINYPNHIFYTMTSMLSSR